jgi:site-specific recombinase XerD
MIHGRIKRYFDKPGYTIGNLTPKQINAFYQTTLDDGCVTNTVIRYHGVLRNAFQHALRSEMIETNPFDKVEQSVADRHQGDRENRGW